MEALKLKTFTFTRWFNWKLFESAKSAVKYIINGDFLEYTKTTHYEEKNEKTFVIPDVILIDCQKIQNVGFAEIKKKMRNNDRIFNEKFYAISASGEVFNFGLWQKCLEWFT